MPASDDRRCWHDLCTLPAHPDPAHTAADGTAFTDPDDDADGAWERMQDEGRWPGWI